MGLTNDEAVSALYRAPFESFVSERKRLAAELKAAGDKSGAAQFAKLGRPSISAWAVNQLWWQARESFDELLETAAELRKGKLAASAAHRKALARLGTRAQQLLSEAGHSANDATLRRVTITLSALAAAGNFEPDAPGALSKDREHDREAEAAERKRAAEAAAAERKLAEAEERQREAERKREAEAQAKREARRKKAENQLAAAKVELAEREHERAQIEKQLATAEREVERARAAVAVAQAELEVD